MPDLMNRARVVLPMLVPAVRSIVVPWISRLLADSLIAPAAFSVTLVVLLVPTLAPRVMSPLVVWSEMVVAERTPLVVTAPPAIKLNIPPALEARSVSASNSLI